MATVVDLVMLVVEGLQDETIKDNRQNIYDPAWGIHVFFDPRYFDPTVNFFYLTVTFLKFFFRPTEHVVNCN